MSPLDRHTLEVLEFQGVLAEVQARAPSSLGKSALGREVPTPLRDEALLRQRRTAQMRQLLEGETELTWGGSRDISPQLERLQAHGSWIEPPALLLVAAFAEAARQVRRAVESAGRDLPDLREAASKIPDYGDLAARIRRCITHEGEVADSASPELGRIRRGVERVRRDLIATLERCFERSGSAIQEKIVTRRGERYVIPVKAGSRGAVPGLVHDRSASGQTLYVEPQGVVEKNNTLRELTAAEKEEVLRILRELGELVRGHRDRLEEGMGLMAALEAVWARAVYSMELDMVEPVIFREENRLELKGARHPILLKSLGAETVPMDFSLGGRTRTLVLTGPNTGGKTVALKTLGLLCLMAQSGLQIPALPGSGMSCFREILADIGDEQSIQQNLSTFSGHMKNIVSLLERSAPGSLVLLDEVGAGTDPSEGAALGIAILEETLARGALTVATTHHNAVKVFASAAEGVANASMEFDSATLGPTYRLVIGVPGRSQAFHIARRLGLAGEIVERARSHQDEGEVRLDGLMADLEEERRSVAAERTALARKERRLEEEEEKRQKAWERKREKLEGEGRRRLREAERDLAGLLREMKGDKSPSAARRVKKSMEKVRGVLGEYAPAPPEPVVDTGTIVAGDRVFLRSLRAWGIVQEPQGEKVTVSIDGKRCTLPAGEVVKREASPEGARKERRTSWGSYSVEVPPMASSEIDLRGLRVEEALARLGPFIEHALLNGLHEIAIIHGKGTGSLQQAVARFLEDHELISTFGWAPLEQGGSGVTRVQLS